jgi:putative transposase
MSRYLLTPTPEQAAVRQGHCAHARFVWNLAVEQQSWWRRGRKAAPGYLNQCRQLTAARAENGWLRAGSQTVQQQALRDFDQAMRNFFAGTHRRPGFRKAFRSNGFRIVGPRAQRVRRLNRHHGQVWIPKVGWVRFRWSRAVPDARSYRVNLDRSGRWHITFAEIPAPVAGPGTGEVVGVDRGIAVSAALSTGDLLNAPRLSPGHQRRLLNLQRKLARAQRGSNRRARVKLGIARLKARENDARKDWCEKLSTDLARRYDVIRVEDLRIKNMVRSARGTVTRPGRGVRAKASLNREIARSGWGRLTERLEQKAPGRIERVRPAYTSQRCSACGHIAAENRKSQTVFRCTACAFTLNADVNAAISIAAGHAVTARGGLPHPGRPTNREPQAA